MRGQCAYTAQTAWIRNDSLRNNILMGRKLYQATYDAVIQACALEQDLQALPAGELAHGLCQICSQSRSGFLACLDGFPIATDT